MGRRLHEATITTRNARAALPIRLHWRAIDPDVHLGYRKGKSGGGWIVRWRSGPGYRQAPLGTADDVLDADGANTFSYAQAASARRSHVTKTRYDDRAAAEGPTPSVKTACEDYCLSINSGTPSDVDGPPSSPDRGSRPTCLQNPKIGGKALHEMKSQDFAAWRVRLRAKRLAETTVRRISNDFRAALNAARARYGSRLPDRFILEVKDGFRITAADPPAQSERPNIILADEDVRRLIKAAKEVDDEEGWDGDLYRLVLGLAATGARFSQPAQASVIGLQPDLKRLVVPSSNKGRGNRKRPPVAVPLGADALQELGSVAKGSPAKEPLFMRWAYKRAGGLNWAKDVRRGWLPAELSEPFRAIVARAGLSADVTAYSLRHSSIVRGLRNNLPVHYSAFIVDALDAAAAGAVISLL